MGNICRSPAGEAVMRHVVESEGLGEKIECDSAGTISFHTGEPPDHRMHAAAQNRNIITGGQARQINEADYNEFDLILTMDEDSAGSAADDSPYALDATGVDTSRVTGQHGNAVRFDGTTSYMVVPHDDALSMESGFTIEAWYRRDGATSDYEVLAIKGDYNYALVLYEEYVVFAYTDALGDTYANTAFGFNDGGVMKIDGEWLSPFSTQGRGLRSSGGTGPPVQRRVNFGV